jgi:hypothetical protein
MSKEALAKVVQRAISDGAFRRQLSSDPATALRGFDLSPDESAAIRSGDAGRLTAMGVELRMSKAFTLSSDQATGDAVRPVLSNDLGASFTGAMNSGVNSAGNAALISGVNSAGNSALDAGMNSAGNSALDAGMNSAAGNAALISGVNSGSNLNQPILTDDSAASGHGAVIGGGPEHALGALTGGEGASATGALDDANAEGFLTPVHTINEGAINQVAITSESAGASSALTGGADAAGNASLSDGNDGYLTSVHTGGDSATNDVLVVDDDAISGAASPGEASGGPNLQQ